MTEPDEGAAARSNRRHSDPSSRSPRRSELAHALARVALDTLAVHAGSPAAAAPDAGEPPPPPMIPSTVPVHLATSFSYRRLEDLDGVFAGTVPGYNYSRYGNPTSAALEELLAALDGGDLALATASGMAAIDLAIRAALADRPRSVVASDALYGQTTALLRGPLTADGIAVRFARATDLDSFVDTIREVRPGAVFLETLSNPLLRVPRLADIVDAAHAAGALVVVDATFTPPVMLRPLDHGADVVVHSLTKFIAGHGDVLAGAIVAKRELAATLTELGKMLGPTLSAFDAYLALRGARTLALRFQRQCENAAKIARFLESHPRISQVHHPSLAGHPDAEAIAALFPLDRHGGMVAFELADAGREEVFRFVDALELVVPATTLGDVHTLVLYPAMSSHRALTRDQRHELGIVDGLVRLSAGIESADDIERDLAQALEA
ncbi:MAG TPA: aminotransferase class I/II-fold pyridoxal phosphate-dependent enzyme [Thermoanaerobaculia bacterium]|nr:aminotransferase class I/II-fold pyridoxal phosphate-dependent enzyme [Thermoanaerobaculia bacterium]